MKCVLILYPLSAFLKDAFGSETGLYAILQRRLGPHRGAAELQGVWRALRHHPPLRGDLHPGVPVEAAGVHQTSGWGGGRGTLDTCEARPRSHL